MRGETHGADAEGERIERLIEVATNRAGMSPFGEVIATAMAGDRGGISVTLGGAETLEGFAFVVPNPDGSSFMAEAALLTPSHVDPMAEALLVAARQAGVEELVWWVHEQEVSLDHPAFVEERELHRMRVALPVDATPHWPDGVTVNGFRKGRDEGAWLDVNNRAFAGHPEQAGWTAEDVAKRTDLAWFDPDGLRMVWSGRRLAAFNWTKLHASAEATEAVVGEIFVIAVDPDHQGTGLGRATIIEGLRDLAERQSASEAVLYVDTAERAAMHLYQSLGFQTEHVSRAYRANPTPGG